MNLPGLNRILETCLYVDDLAAAERFYVDILELTFYSRQAGRHVFLRCGSQMLLLFDPQASLQPDSSFPHHGATGPGHVAFGVSEQEIDAWAERLVHCGVPLETVIEWPQGGRSLYFRDPAGNSIEIATPKIWGLPS